MSRDARSPLRVAWFIWGLGASFYLMGFFHRMAPAVMTEELMREFGINAASLGNLSSLYFYSYTVMQIPTGIIADVWGPRRLLTMGALVAGIGTLLFSAADNVVWAGVGRFLIGGSVAVAFVGVLKVVGNWFPSRYYAMLTGMTLCFGLFGAVGAGTPLRLLMNHYRWRDVILLSAMVTFALCACIWIFVRDYPREKECADSPGHPYVTHTVSHKKLVMGIFEVFKYPNILLLCVIPGGIVGCVLTFTGLWGVPFLTTLHGISTSRAAALTSALLMAWAVGGPFLGWLSDRLGYRKPLYVTGCAIAGIGWILTLYVSSIPISLLTVLFLITGFSSGSMIIGFSFAKESVPPYLSGTVTGVINMGVMMGPMLMQPAVGLILDRKWKGEMVNSVRLYGVDAYQTGFSLMMVWLAVSFILLLFTRETHCRQTA